MENLPCCTQNTVDKARHNAAIQSILQREASQGSIANTLGDDSEGCGDPCNGVTQQHLQAVAHYPGQDGQSVQEELLAAHFAVGSFSKFSNII